MDKKQITQGTAGIIGVFLIIIGTVYFTPEQLENAYVCLATEEIGIFYGGISGTGLSAYPYKENRTDVERCYASNGEKSSWIKLTDYLEEEISLDEFLQPKEITNQNIRKSYLCSIDGCIEK
ncbi:hypothetical protein LCGC14_2094980 [marine sediment metagenome]|uniref:Uncharacterized protein n=1 Tax=marine sediment metagenome TaxID=412755 RepID=A0A0F9EBV9_9ZZZZ